MGVTQVARATGLYPGTTYNILKTLVGERLVAFDAKAKTYALDVGVLKLAHDLLNRAGILRHVHPILLELCDATGATAFLLKLVEREELVLIDAASSEGMFDLHIFPGRRFRGLPSASGLVVAAFGGLPAADLARLFDATPWHTPPALPHWRVAIAATRENGYAVERNGMYPGLLTVAAPLFDGEVEFAMVIGVVAVAERVPPAQETAVAHALLRAARQIDGIRPLLHV